MSQEVPPKLNPLAMSLDAAARVLSASGKKPVTVELLRADLRAGAPTNADGTINLIHYCAWLAKEMGRGD